MTDQALDLIPDRADRITMRVIAVLTAAMAGVLAAGQVTAAATFVWADSLALSLLADEQLAIEPDRGVSAAGVETVVVTADALSGGARAVFAGGATLLALTALIVGFALAWLLVAASGGRPFRPALYRFSLISGFALVLGPLAATTLTGFGSMQAAFELNDALGGILLPGFGVTSWGMTIPIVGLGVIALAYLFRRMERLQRDTELLV